MAKVQKKASRKNTPKLKSDSKNVKIKRKGSDKPFDRTFRTMAEKMPELLIPLINEVFGTDYPLDEEVMQLRNEHQQEDGELITDSCLLIGRKMYHIECQSKHEKSIKKRGENMNKESITMNYTKEVALSFLCQAMQDETIRLRKARKKERASIKVHANQHPSHPDL